MTTLTEQPGGGIIVVDDLSANLRLLVELLEAAGHNVRAFLRGRQALAAAVAEPPELILLDVDMPELDGYEVCRQLKAEPRTEAIPVIFISALNQPVDKINGFAAGGVDYITKPFDVDEVRARVATHLNLQRLRLELDQRYTQLRELEELRDGLVHMIVHDLRTPLYALRFFFDLVQTADTSQPAQFVETVCGSSALALQSTNVLIDMVNSVLDVSRLEAGEPQLHVSECDLRAVIGDALLTVELPHGRRPIEVDCGPGSLTILADTDMVRRVVQNLLANAIKFTTAEHGHVRVSASVAGGWARVEVHDNGPGIPPADQARVFEKFVQVHRGRETRSRSTGLGLAFCKLAVTAHGGRIGLDSEVGSHSTFWFELPVD